MSDCLHEMSLSQAGISVDEEWVVNLSRGLAYRVGGGSSQLI
jgi:hypothetical protein